LDNAKANALGTAQIRASADAYNVESTSLAMTTGNALAYAAVQNRINEEARKGNILKPEQIAALRTEATALGAAAQNAENMRAGYDALTNSGQTFLSSLRGGASVWDSFKSAGVNALDTVSQKLMKMATDNLWTSAFGGSSGGIFSNLFGGGSGSAVDAVNVGNYSMPTIGFDGGGFTGAGGKYQPAGIVHRGEYVIDAASTSRIGVANLDRLRGYAAGGIVDDMSPLVVSRVAPPSGSTDAPVTISIPISIDATGADAAGLARVQQQLASLEKSVPAMAVAALKKARSGRDF
jgi:phage-related minor tail protein